MESFEDSVSSLKEVGIYDYCQEIDLLYPTIPLDQKLPSAEEEDKNHFSPPAPLSPYKILSFEGETFSSEALLDS